MSALRMSVEPALLAVLQCRMNADGDASSAAHAATSLIKYVCGARAKTAPGKRARAARSQEVKQKHWLLRQEEGEEKETLIPSTVRIWPLICIMLDLLSLSLRPPGLTSILCACYY